MKRLLIVLSLLLSFTMTAGADEASHKELAEKLFKVTNMAESFDNTCQEIINMQISGNPMMEPFKDVLTEFFYNYMSWESLKPDITRLYMQTFTEDELRDIVSFLSSPVGIMYTEKSFELTMKCMELGQQKVNENMGELEAMIAAKADKMVESAQQAAPADSEATPAPTE